MDTKERILHASLELFARDGYEAVSMRDIAGKLGLTQSAIYKHYEGKRAIFEQIVERMRLEDAVRARAYALPEGSLAEMRPAYRSAAAEELARFSLAQFRYWTEDAFASDFRKLLTLEQYRTPEMSALYQQYLCGGVIGYLTDLFAENPALACGKRDEPRRLALTLYAPIYLLMNQYDAAERPETVTALAQSHIRSFFAATDGPPDGGAPENASYGEEHD